MLKRLEGDKGFPFTFCFFARLAKVFRAFIVCLGIRNRLWFDINPGNVVSRSVKKPRPITTTAGKV